MPNHKTGFDVGSPLHPPRTDGNREFWQHNREDIVLLMCAILSNPSIDPLKISESDLLTKAGRIVGALVNTKLGESY